MENKLIFTSAYRNIVGILRKKRLELDLKQEELAEKTGKTQTFIHRLEKYQQRLDLHELFILSQALEIDFIELCNEFRKDMAK